MSEPRFYLAIVLLISIRLWHFGPSIDEPHAWRQCDTAYYIQDFFENGIDLLHPAVCWMGATDTLALEFPLPEAMAAVCYWIFGESIPLARLVFLLFFIGATYYFHQIIDFLFGIELARLATLIYLALPLSYFYSRAIHIDFSVIFFTHVMVYYFLIGIGRKKGIFILLSAFAACFSFTIKAPYAFYWALPMLWFSIDRKAFIWAIPYMGAYFLPVLLFLLWQWHVRMINDQAPDLDYILHYHKMTQSSGWYFGTWRQRLSLYPWWVLFQRGILDVAGLGGIAVFVLGLMKIRKLDNFQFLIYWMTGVILYVLIFFNLNFVHNYYQIPLLAPVAAIVGRGVQMLGSYHVRLYCISLSLIVAANLWYAETHYFIKQPVYEEIGRLIQYNTPDRALVIVTFDRMDCRNPQLLYRARRRGWSVEEAALKPIVIERLRHEEGAQFWAYVGPELPKSLMPEYFDSLALPEVFNLQGEDLKLFIFKFSD